VIGWRTVGNTERDDAAALHSVRSVCIFRPNPRGLRLRRPQICFKDIDFKA